MADIKRETAVDFEKEVLPILKNNCLACHGESKPKAGLVLETPRTILKGGDSGPAVVPGKSSESLLLKAAAHQDPDMLMPPRDNKVNAGPLKPEELGLLKLWIDQGATGQVATVTSIQWQPVPESVKPIYAIALTSDGQLAACGRANDIFIYHLPGRRLLTRLVDTNLGSASHYDLVQSLAFSPDGQLLASGGYREVKLWRRPGPTSEFTLTANGLDRIASSPDGKWIVTATTKGLLTSVDPATGKEVGSTAGHTGKVAVLSCSIDGLRVVSVGDDSTVRLWTMPELKPIASTNLANRASAGIWLSDGRLALAGDDKAIRIYAVDATNGTLAVEKELKGHEGVVTSLHGFASISTQIISGSSDGSVRIWDLAKGETVRTIKHGAPVLAVAVRHDGQRVASAGTNGARLWNVADGKQIAVLKGDRHALEALASAERDLAFAKAEVAYQKGAMEAAEKQLKTANERLTKATEAFTTADKSFTEKQTTLKAANDGKAAAEKTLVDLNTELKTVTDNFQTAEKASKQASADAKSAIEKATQAKLSADQAAQTKIDTERMAADAVALAAKAKSASSNGVPEGAKAAAEKMAADAASVAEKAKAFAESASADAAAKTKLAEETKAAVEKAIDQVAAKSFALGQLKPAFDRITAESPEKIKQATEKMKNATNALVAAEKEFQKSQQTRSIAEQESQLAKTAAEQGTNGLDAAKAKLKEAEELQKQTEAKLEIAKKTSADSEKPIRAVAFSPDNTTVATTADDGKVHTWSADTGAAFDAYPPNLEGTSYTSPRRFAAFGDAAQLVILDAGGKAALWRLNAPWKLERTIGSGAGDSPLVDRVNAVRFNRASSWLATGGGEPSRSGEIKIWKIADGSLLNSFGEVHSDAVLALDFSPDDKYIASGSADKFVRVVDIGTGKLVKSFEGHTHHVLGVSWKRDGRTIASSGADNLVKVWDFTSGERRKNIEGFNKEVTSVAFVGMDQALASSGDTQVRLVKENGENVRAFTGATDFVYSAAATPDGKIIIAGGQDSALRVWDGSDGKTLMTFLPEQTSR